MMGGVPGWTGVGLGVYKMMIVVTICQNTSIYAIPDHFIRTILASEYFTSMIFWHVFSAVLVFSCTFAVFLGVFGGFSRVFSRNSFFRTSFLETTFFLEQSSRIFWVIPPVFPQCCPGFCGKNQGSGSL